MKFRSILINLVIAGFWLVSMYWVYNQHYSGPTAIQLAGFQTVNSPQMGNERWYDITMANKKIGYAMNTFGSTPLGYVFKDYSLLRLPMAGVMREILMDFYAVVDTSYALKTFTFGLSSDDYSTNVYGQIAGGNLFLKVMSDSTTTDLVSPAPKGIYLPGTIPLILAAKGFPPGKFQLAGFDPISLSTSDMIIDVGGQTQIVISGRKFDVHKVVVTTSGISSYSFVTSDGMVVREEETGNMAMTLTSKEKALDVPETMHNWDMLKSLAVNAMGQIEDARDCRYLKVELDGIEGAGFSLEDDFQRVVSQSPLMLEIKPEGFRRSSIPATKFLKAQPMVQSDDPRIMLKARQIVGNLKSDSLQIAAITNWVYSNIEKDYAISLPSAIEVLRVKKGDCNEHSALFTALTRSLGIPTKICLGVVYKDGLFYYHAWPAVYLNGRWLPVDPTFGQQTADATHIKLLEGSYESTVGLMRVIGKLTVRIVDSENSRLAEK
ncbi:MAG: transglutaminase domain-containing protein [candidate division Zixibacteria bacterium]|nr:transglutaminase domain-containing protein [candidate division Zixibacteria bacterium]